MDQSVVLGKWSVVLVSLVTVAMTGLLYLLLGVSDYCLVKCIVKQ